MTDLLITDVRLVDAVRDLHGDLYIKDGIIQAIGRKLNVPGARVLPGDGRLLLPAFVDMHAHFRDPGYPEKEDIASGSRAAAHGGYTAVAVMANTNPVCDSADIARYMLQQAEKEGFIDLFPLGAITRGLAGETLSNMDGLAQCTWAFSDDGYGVQRTDIALLAFSKVASLKRRIVEHCQYNGIDNWAKSEELMLNRDLLLADMTGCSYHMAHVSSGRCVELIASAKRSGVSVTCEVTPHHLCLEPGYVVNPPLVPADVRQRLIAALADGTIDVIATDHAPHTAKDKEKGAPGISGIETAFPLLYSKLVLPGKLDLSTLVRAMATNPAKILGLNRGSLEPNLLGDVVMISDEEFTVTEESLLSRGKNTPLLGERLRGKICATISRGKIIYMDGKLDERYKADNRQVV
jgi:dihydroorotase